ncbi:hypothetical protein [Pseudomonas sp. PDM19]|uniref:hypothetical protein n=1 Tax=Pseudomonas sp. PDM19 TaxID=2769272 RepID=UPI00178543C9|nr:hypothetical protein [Pseudomonas sp. PDM19]MBD9634594.1 hypothetical protein [Pseudomonas sp. PDM19]
MTTQSATAPKKYQYSTARLKGHLVLNTEQAKAFSGNRFDNVMTALFVIDVVARKLAQKLKSFDYQAVASAVSTKLANAEKAISDDTARISALLGALAQCLPEYDHPQERAYEITSPEIARFGALLKAYDHLIMLVDAGWLGGVIESGEADAFRQEKHKQINKLVRFLVGTGQAARTKAYASKSLEMKADLEQADAQEQTEKEERKASGFVEPESNDLDAVEQIEARETAIG